MSTVLHSLPHKAPAAKVCKHERRVFNYSLGYEQCAACNQLLPALHKPHNPRHDFSD